MVHGPEPDALCVRDHSASLTSADAFAYRMPPAGFYTPLSPMTPSFNASIYRREAAPSPISPEYAPWSR